MYTLVDRDIAQRIRSGGYTATDMTADTLSYCIQPASLDIPLGTTAYMIEHSCIPTHQTVRETVQPYIVDTLDLRTGAVLLTGHTYLIPCATIDLPTHYIGKISPKSSVGRIDVLTRGVSDNTGMLDYLPSGYTGELRLEVTPQSFNIRVKHTLSISQIRLFDTTPTSHIATLPEDILRIKNASIPPQTCEGDVVLTLSISSSQHDRAQPIGYVARHTDRIIDLTKYQHYDHTHFFHPICTTYSGTRDRILLRKDHFYILATRESIRVPSERSMEILPFSHHTGELRSHYAGFFDPGFGGATGRQGVLEIRPLHDMLFVDGQPVCVTRFYKNLAKPDHIYGEYNNSYTCQHGPRLSKFFVSP